MSRVTRLALPILGARVQVDALVLDADHARNVPVAIGHTAEERHAAAANLHKNIRRACEDPEHTCRHLVP